MGKVDEERFPFDSPEETLHVGPVQIVESQNALSDAKYNDWHQEAWA